MIDLTTPIIPYVGTGIFKLNSSYDEIKNFLQKNNISYKEEISQPNDIDPPWYIIGIYKNGEKDDVISLTFAKNRLFRICLYEGFEGKLANGIHIGMSLAEAQRIDPSLTFDDWDEMFVSDNGYWVEDDIYTNKLCWITIFIPAFERDDFFEYNW